MGRQVLLLRLEGVWQSWGERSRWDVRDTATEPTKSGVMGLLGCALGYPMRDPRLETELDAGLRFGVRVENPGRVVQDYQTVTGFLPTAEGSFRHSGVSTAKSLEKLLNNPDVEPSTIVSPRYYLEEASFLVALQERDGFDGLLNKCAAALKSPKWPIYLGRKACVPTRPVFDPIYDGLRDDYEDITQALERHPWSWLRGGMLTPDQRPDKLHIFIETPDGRYSRQDVVRSNRIRTYGFRREDRRWVATPKGGENDVSVSA